MKTSMSIGELRAREMVDYYRGQVKSMEAAASHVEAKVAQIRAMLVEDMAP